MIINLTQHLATAEQRAAGVVDLPEPLRLELAGLLTFDKCPTWQEVEERSHAMALLAQRANGQPERAMIGGAPWMMAQLTYALADRDILPLFSFSRPESVEAVQPDGIVRKASVFRHVGFVGDEVAE